MLKMLVGSSCQPSLHQYPCKVVMYVLFCFVCFFSRISMWILCFSLCLCSFLRTDLSFIKPSINHSVLSMSFGFKVFFKWWCFKAMNIQCNITGKCFLSTNIILHAEFWGSVCFWVLFIFTCLSHCYFIFKWNWAILIKRCSNITFDLESVLNMFKRKNVRKTKGKGKKRFIGWIFHLNHLHRQVSTFMAW